jgi:hypothetical protein
VAGVKLEPDGQRFAAPLQLTIDPATAVPVDEQVPFGFQGAGSNFHEVAVELGTPKLVFNLMHFSGYGVARGTTAERQALENSELGDPEATLEEAVAQIMDDKRIADALGQPGDPDYVHKLEVAMLRYYQEQIREDLAAARTSCYAAQNALPRAIAWVHNAQMMGLSNDFREEIVAITGDIVAAIDHCWSEMTQPCVYLKDIGQVQTALELVRTAALFNLDVSKYNLTKVKACGWAGTVTITEKTTGQTVGSGGMVTTSSEVFVSTYTISPTTLADMQANSRNVIIKAQADFTSNSSESLNGTTSVACPHGTGVTYTTVTYAHQRTLTGSGSGSSEGEGNVTATNGKLTIELSAGKPIPTTQVDHLVESYTGTCGGKDDYHRDETTSLDGEMVVLTTSFQTDIDPKSGTSSGAQTREVSEGTSKTTTTTTWNLTQIKN